VTAVRVRVGALRQAVPESIRFHFEIVARGTLCEGARLEQRRVSAVLRCPTCRNEWDPEPQAAETAEHLIPVPRFRCPSCRGGEVEVVAGDELVVESIDVEEDSCIAPK
jgi:hydrogenase nickel incorporation protein HypA/HybF